MFCGLTIWAALSWMILLLVSIELTHAFLIICRSASSESKGWLVVNWGDRNNWATCLSISNELACACLYARTEATRCPGSKAENIYNIFDKRYYKIFLSYFIISHKCSKFCSFCFKITKLSTFQRKRQPQF